MNLVKLGEHRLAVIWYFENVFKNSLGPEGEDI